MVGWPCLSQRERKKSADADNDRCARFGRSAAPPPPLFACPSTRPTPPLCHANAQKHSAHRPSAAAAAVPFTSRPPRQHGLLPLRRRPPATSSMRAPASSSTQSAAAAASANLSGLYARCDPRSDAANYEKALDLLGLSGLQRLTAKLIDGLEIEESQSQFKVSFVTVVPFFKVTESVPIGGGAASLPRRDLKPGRQTCVARRIPPAAGADGGGGAGGGGGGVRVEMSWGEPLAGGLVEEYTLLPDGALRVRATTTVGGRSVTADTVYLRTRMSRDQLLQERQARRR